jgi:uncharacterized protein
MDPLVIAFGLGVGILVGLTGIGGGSIFIVHVREMAAA